MSSTTFSLATAPHSATLPTTATGCATAHAARRTVITTAQSDIT